MNAKFTSTLFIALLALGVFVLLLHLLRKQHEQTLDELDDHLHGHVMDAIAKNNKNNNYNGGAINNNQYNAFSEGSSTCDNMCTINESVFDVFAPGADWAAKYLNKAAKETEQRVANLGCDLSALDTPIHIVDITSLHLKYRTALHPPGVDLFVSDGQRESGTPFEGWWHGMYYASLKVVAKMTGRKETDHMLVLDAGDKGEKQLTWVPIKQFFAALGHEVHTFEPFVKNMRLLRCSAQVNKFTNLVLQRVALSNETSAARKCLNAPQGNIGGTTLSDDCDGLNYKEAEKYEHSTDIRTIKLDDYWRVVLKNRRPDVMKIDIEGYEVKAFLGATEILKYAPPYFVFSELFASKILDTGYKPIDYVNIMQKNGYLTFLSETLEPFIIEERADILVEHSRNADVVFVHKDVFKGRSSNSLKKVLGM
ncbi:hypothetical protein HDU76_012452 [Blyttiomyces sp. JEL0837]|nr:hypothetical protein HDU76_012452 [Blyttiomyces sp. JEL0837]